MTAVFGVLLLIAILLSCALLLVVCSLCSKRSKREPEIRQYVFEGEAVGSLNVCDVFQFLFENAILFEM